MKLTFWGAARQVTGSMFLLELEDDLNILIDCGMDMDRKSKPKPDHPGIFPFEPSMIHAVILTHAHIDHSGFIPNLIREGFEGRVICTDATYELARILMSDIASLNQRRLQKFNKKRKKNPSLPPPEGYEEMYLQKQVNEALGLFATTVFRKKRRLTDEVSVTLLPAGHLLGAAHVVLHVKEKGEEKTICFSGDIGRYNYPLLVDPEPIPEVDYLVCETTYGNRRHQSRDDSDELILDVIKSTCVDQPGKLIVPAFSVGRTQAMLYTLNRLSVQEKLPSVPVYTDSPLALQSTQIYQKFIKHLNAEAQEFYAKHGPLFDFENLIYLERTQDSKRVAQSGEPAIIISSSGMIHGGRIEYHVKENLTNSQATILMIGYAAEGTLGYDLIHGDKMLTIDKKQVPVRSRVERTDTFSGHGDLDDLIHFVKWQKPENLKKVFLVHGEEQSMHDFKETILAEGYSQVEIPSKGDSYEL